MPAETAQTRPPNRAVSRVPTDHLWLPYTQMLDAPTPLRAARTEGCRIVLDDGRELIDSVSSWWTACHGYNHPHIVDAMERQLRTMPHVMFGGLVHEPAERLAERLAALLPGSLERVFFADSGSVAVEVAMKMAVQVWLNRGEGGRTRFLSFRGGYHGDTLAAMSVTDPEEGMHAIFRGYLPQQTVCDLPRDAHPNRRCAIARRPRQRHRPRDRRAAGPVRGRHEDARCRCPANHCGCGARRWHAADLRRDRGQFWTRRKPVRHPAGGRGARHHLPRQGADRRRDQSCSNGGDRRRLRRVPVRPTRGGADARAHHMARPLACAAANASLDLFETEPRLAQSAAIEETLTRDLAPLAGLPGVVDVRVKGAIGAVEVAGAPISAGSKRSSSRGRHLAAPVRQRDLRCRR